MTDRWQQVTAGIALVGGGLAVVSSIPGAWYGLEPGDSYVFDPVPFSPLWIDRTVVPLLSVGALLALLVGVGSLVYRDWARGRLHRVGGVGTVVGGLTLLAGIYAPAVVTPRGTPDGIVASLAALTLLLWGGVLLLIGGTLFAYSALRAGRSWLGWTMLGTLPAVFVLGYVLPDPIDGLGSSLPLLFLAAVFARELLGGGPVADPGPD